MYIFLDEGGNLDFSGSGTKYFTFTSLSKERPFKEYKAMNDLKYDLIELETEIEYFHASEDRQAVRNRLFRVCILMPLQPGDKTDNRVGCYDSAYFTARQRLTYGNYSYNQYISSIPNAPLP